MAARIGWHSGMPLSWADPIDTAQSSYESTNSGVVLDETSGFTAYQGGVNQDGGSGVVVWTETWIPVGTDPSPYINYDGTGAFFRTPGGNQFPPVHYFEGELQMRATLNGVPLEGYLRIVFTNAPDYGTAAWDAAGIVVQTCDFSGSPRGAGIPLNANFTDLSTPEPVSWSWTFGDGGTSTDQNPAHAYVVPGLYGVRLSINGGAFSRSRDEYIAAVATDFVGAPLLGPAVLDVQFTDFSGAPIDEWLINESVGSDTLISERLFSGVDVPTDNGTGVIADPSDFGGNVIQKGGGPPLTDFFFLGNSTATAALKFKMGVEADFIAGGSTAYALDVNRFNDGSFICLLAIQAVGSGDPLPFPQLQLWFNNGGDKFAVFDFIDQAAHNFEIFIGPDNIEPRIDGAPGITPSIARVAVNFSPTFSFYLNVGRGGYDYHAEHHYWLKDIEVDLVPTAWSWDFGDGSAPSVEQNPLHSYSAPGVYDVALTATYDFDFLPGGPFPVIENKPAYVTVTGSSQPPETEDLGMPLPTLPISRLINVQVNLAPTAAAIQNLSNLLILGNSSVIDPVERYRVYSDISSVAADFGTTAPEYLAAVLWFEQVPQPSELLIGRWIQTASQGGLKGGTLPIAAQAMSVFTPIADGKFTYAKDGGAPVTTGAINLTGALNLPGVAALITAQTPGVTFTWNSVFQRFEAVSATTGATSEVTFLTTPGSGTDISGLLGMRADQSGAYLIPGAAAETAVNAAAFFDLNYGQKWYGLFIIAAADADHIAVAALVNAMTNKHTYFVSTQEAGSIVAASTTDIGYVLQQAGYRRAFVQYSSSNPYAVVSAAARILTTDYAGNSTVITLMYKQEPGIVPEFLNTTQASAAEAKNINLFAEYNNDTAIIEKGTCADGTFLDVLIGCDWLSLEMQGELYNLLYTSPTKIPQTDAGTQMLVAVIEAVCAQGVINGLLAPGTWTTNGFGQLGRGDFLPKGFYVYAPKVSTQSAADRAARKAVPIQVAAKLAGAVHTLAITVNVNA